jgi:hypothetical protein
LGLAHLGLSHWSEAFVSCILSVELFGMFRKDQFVARLRWIFLPLDLGWSLVTTDSPNKLKILGLIHRTTEKRRHCSSDRQTHSGNTIITN